MKLFKKKDKIIEAEENLAKNAESAKTAADGKIAGAAQNAKRMSLRQSFVQSVERDYQISCKTAQIRLL